MSVASYSFFPSIHPQVWDRHRTSFSDEGDGGRRCIAAAFRPSSRSSIGARGRKVPVSNVEDRPSAEGYEGTRRGARRMPHGPGRLDSSGECGAGPDMEVGKSEDVGNA